MKYLALTELDNDNRVIAIVIFDSQVNERIKRALQEHFDNDIDDLIIDDKLNACLSGCIRELSFNIDDYNHKVEVQQIWLY